METQPQPEPHAPRNRRRIPITFQLILDRVCKAFGVSDDQVKSVNKSQSRAYARHAVCMLAREFTSMSYPELGLAIGRDKQVIMSGVRRGRWLEENDPRFGEHVRLAREELLALFAGGARVMWDDEKARVFMARAKRAAGSVANGTVSRAPVATGLLYELGTTQAHAVEIVERLNREAEK